MSDAPRWPGADGSPGLDFSRKPDADPQKPAGNAEGGPRPTSGPKPQGAPAKGSGAQDKPQPSAPSLDEGATRAVKLPRSAQSATDARPDARKSQNANDWELDSITRSTKSEPGPPGPQPVASGASASRPVEAPAPTPRPSRAATSDSESAGHPLSRASSSRRTRKARLRINRIDPWSVMKTSFLFSIAFGVMLVAGVGVLWSVVAGSDALNTINDLVNSVVADPQGGGERFNIHEFLGWQRVMGLTTVLAAIDVVIFTAVATLFAFLYNLASVVMGGLEITLAED
ncbi:DUF3566 domain-containing protein [uncultured Tessaracoccus sp.]|uniref:DUF3566 domain-containing protein n=1 Tax=uncultured Tessaracoccus sp. TaxID=905023 RepID=UPI0026264C66|nr:DUF3566 domain-containing protein [uncultured Tessaracoccus sp.]